MKADGGGAVVVDGRGQERWRQRQRSVAKLANDEVVV